MCRIYTRRDADFLDQNGWNEQHEWLRTNLEKLHQVFAARIKLLDATKVGVGNTDDDVPIQ